MPEGLTLSSKSLRNLSVCYSGKLLPRNTVVVARNARPARNALEDSVSQPAVLV